MGEALVSMQDVRFAYEGRPDLLRGVDLSLLPGERLGLCGANGSGKSTLLHLLVGLRKPSSGRVQAFGRTRSDERDFVEVRQRVGFVFQNSDDQLFCPTVLEDVAFGPLNLGKSASAARAAADEALALVGLEGFEERITYRLSGGEKRLVCVATVLSMDPEVLLLDEPTAGLDEVSRRRLVDVLKALPQAMVIVSHEESILGELATRRVLLDEGRLRDPV